MATVVVSVWILALLALASGAQPGEGQANVPLFGWCYRM